MYRIHITVEPQAIGAARTFRVGVFLPGQSSATPAVITEHNLLVVLYEILPNATAGATPDEYLNKAHSPDGAMIEIENLSEQHSNMLRGLPPPAVGR
jgi:hypothetical protein